MIFEISAPTWNDKSELSDGSSKFKIVLNISSNT